jgi:hypothetical protein
MADDLAAANVNRSYQLAASSIAIFTFLLFFLCIQGSSAATLTLCRFKPR